MTPHTARVPVSTVGSPVNALHDHRRTEELDGLRGIAALTVMFWHFFSLFPTSTATFIWKMSPLYLLIGGGEAVVLFFVLSGFALSRMYVKSGMAGYRSFAVRRTIRIYGPYLCALTLAVVSDRLLSKGYRSHFNPWFNRTWTLPFQWPDVWAHVAFLGVYNNTRFNTAFWSLVHEMRISLVFPFLYLLLTGRRALTQISVAVSLVITGAIAGATFLRNSDIGGSVLFAGLFVSGLCIFERKTRLAEFYISLGPRSRATAVVLTILLFCYGRLTSHAFPASLGSLLCLPVGLGASGLVVLAFSSPVLSSFLKCKAVAWFGKISYSLYLVHGTVLFGLINLLDLQAPALSLIWLYTPLALMTAWAFHASIEAPLISQSRKAGRRSKNDSN